MQALCCRDVLLGMVLLLGNVPLITSQTSTTTLESSTSTTTLASSTSTTTTTTLQTSTTTLQTSTSTTTITSTTTTTTTVTLPSTTTTTTLASSTSTTTTTTLETSTSTLQTSTSTTTTTNTTTTTSTNTSTTTSTNTSTTTTTNVTTTTNTSTTTTTNATTTTSTSTSTTTTTTITTTLYYQDRDCPVRPDFKIDDDYGNYTHVPGTKLLNETWKLSCLPGYVQRDGKDEAHCNARGQLVMAACISSMCHAPTELAKIGLEDASETTCNETMQQGDICTWKCDRSVTYQVYGFWTCFQGRFVGAPICTNREGRHWKVVWVLTKIRAEMKMDVWCQRAQRREEKDVNMTNATNEMFRRNVSIGFAAPFGLNYFDFSPLDVVYRSTQKWVDFKSQHWMAHSFDINYGLVVWDVNELEDYTRVATDMGMRGSDARESFLEYVNGTETGDPETGLMACKVADLYYVVAPAPYETTMVAPDSQDDVNGARHGSTRPWLSTILGVFVISWLLSAAWTDRSEVHAPTPCRAPHCVYRGSSG